MTYSALLREQQGHPFSPHACRASQLAHKQGVQQHQNWPKQRRQRFAKECKAQTPQVRGCTEMSKNIKELREALQRQAKETLKLQEEASKFSAESITCREGTVSPSNMTSSSASVQLKSNPSLKSSSKRGSIKESSTGPSSVPADSSPPKILYTKYELDIDGKRRHSYTGKEYMDPGKEHVETILEEYVQQVRDLQKKLSEDAQQHEQQKFTLRQTIIELQANLREVQKEKDSITDLRRRESQTQEKLNSQMRTTISDLETASQLQEEMQKEANNQIEQLKKLIQAHEDVLQQLRKVLVNYEESSGKKICEPDSIANLHVCNLPNAFGKVIRELSAEVSHLKGRVTPLEEQVEVLKTASQSKTELLLQQHQESIEKLISEHEKELDILSEKASASQSHASSIQSQLEIIQEQAKTQNSLYMRQINQLEDTVSELRSELRESRRASEDKIEELEKELHLAHSEMSEAQSERDQYSQETGSLDGQVHQLLGELSKKSLELNLEKEQNKRLWDRDTGSSITIDNLRRELDSKNMELQRMESMLKAMKMECQGQMERQMSAIREKNESLEKVASVTAQQESTKDMLRKVVQELTEKKMNLEAAERQVADLTSCLQEKERVIASTNEEIQKLRGRVDSKLQELQQLKNEGDQMRSIQAECESFRMQAQEKEKLIEILRKQIDSMTQIVGQHGRTAGAMEMEKSQLSKEVNDKKMEIQELKMLQDKKDGHIRELEASLSELELDKVKLVNTSSERLRVLKEMNLEREDLLTEIKASRIELAALTEESEAVKNEYREKTEEMETTVTKLKVQLNSVQIELDQTRATLKTMEGSDGHAMKVAMGMQKQVTAKRGQIDALQSKIKFLEEAMANATKEKHFLKEERNKLSQEMTTLACLNNKMSGELEILKSQDKRLREKLATMEAALDKASMQFAECQCIMQRQEQEAMRFKLQHTLDIKELQGPGYTLGSSVKPRHSSMPHSHSSSAPASQAFAGHHTSSFPPRTSFSKEDPLRDLKQLLQELRSTIDEIPSSILPRRDSDSESDSVLEDTGSTFDLASRECIGKRSHKLYSREAAVRDLPSDATMGQNPFCREPLTLHTADLEDPDTTHPFTSSAIFSSTPHYSSSKKLSSEERYKDRSPVHSLLTTTLDDLKAASGPSMERRSSLKKSYREEPSEAIDRAASAACRGMSFSTSSKPDINFGTSSKSEVSFSSCPKPEVSFSSCLKPEMSFGISSKPEMSFGSSVSTQTADSNGNTCRKLQNKMESLQNLVETLQLKNQAMSTMIRCQEKKIEQAKEKEKKLSK
ncbi:coiled-coil domain-containing protein 158 isoform X2 [Hemicordylus capensis]|uniref:coiled-coil domain-containing protein 158 isoform X2 n=1 Tax=Hemicordylus capensis TaxID=884348 RepID=UPI0023044C72|nr:coiled-coil domain-containing protein 158 isoform X2 [Hemicordylus capensis]